jgi:hypothetical protein
MWQKVADGVWAVEGADGLPTALATTLDDGTPLKVAEQWWAARQNLLEWAASGEAREWLGRHDGLQGPTGDSPG